MKVCSVMLFLQILALNSVAQSPLDSLLAHIDQSIENHEVYLKKKETRLQDLRNQLKQARPISVEEYNINLELYKEYKPYVCDSAIHYLNKNIEIAKVLHNLHKQYQSTLLLSYLMGSAGMYKEAVDILLKVDRKRLPQHLLRDYYITYDHVYGELAFYTQDRNSANIYRKISDQYKDSLNIILPAYDEQRLAMQETVFRDAKNFAEARKINDIRLAKTKSGTPEYALITFYRSLSYKHEHNVEKEKYYLALSALSDIRSSTKDHASLWMLAQILFEEGEIERAYNYIRFSWNETVFYNARLRSLQSAVILSLIDKTFQAMIEKQNSKLQNYLLLISVLVLLLIVALLYISTQMKKLAVARENTQLINHQLKQLNHRLEKTNTDLSESNLIKEEYIGRFIKLCSTYIEKLDIFRRMVNKRIANNEISELLRVTRSPETLDEEFEELYSNFDNAFLQIFPDFVEKVNELLHEEDKIVLKKGDLLNSELRILALIRLGIKDSSQIAEFLRYSVNTIYNYRAKIKNRAVLREDFESLIMMIR